MNRRLCVYSDAAPHPSVMRGVSRQRRVIGLLSMKKLRLGTIFVVLCAAMMPSCATYSPVNTDRVIAGVPVGRLEIFVEKPYSFKPKWAWMMHTLPSGLYRPDFEDDQGVYFQAPKHIILGDILIGSQLRDGGIYLKFDAIDQPYLYMVIDRAATYKLPPDFVLNLREVQK